jgi:DNA-binding GntR family transcriptional regulator
LPHRIEQSILEHREMIRAIEGKDLSQFEKLIVKHHTFSKNSYLAQVKGLPPMKDKGREGRA